MRISRNKKILVTAITVFSISAIGISINALTGAFSLDSMSRDEKYKTDAYIARAGDEIKDEYEDEFEDEDEDEGSPENLEDGESSDIDAVTSATPETDEPGGEYPAGEEAMINQGVSQGSTSFDIESSATPKESLTIPGKPSSQNASSYQNTQPADVVSSATPKTGSPTTAPGVQPAPVEPAAPGIVPAPAVDVVSSATPKTGSPTTAPGVQSAPVEPAAPGIVPAPAVDVVSSATPKEPSAGSPSTSSPDSSTGTTAGINSDAAKQIVLGKIPGAAITECELDQDDGILIYDIEAYLGQNKYTFIIDANTGAILSYRQDIAETDDDDENEDEDEPNEPDDDDDDD